MVQKHCQIYTDFTTKLALMSVTQWLIYIYITKELASPPFHWEKANKELKDASAENISLSVPAFLLPLLVKLLKNTLSLTQGEVCQIILMWCYINYSFTTNIYHRPNVITIFLNIFIVYDPLRLVIQAIRWMQVHHLVVLHCQVAFLMLM